VKSIEILATGTLMPLIMEGLEQAFTLHVLPAAGERDAFLEIGRASCRERVSVRV
jgi:hypothetical protein